MYGPTGGGAGVGSIAAAVPCGVAGRRGEGDRAGVSDRRVRPKAGGAQPYGSAANADDVGGGRTVATRDGGAGVRSRFGGVERCGAAQAFETSWPMDRWTARRDVDATSRGVARGYADTRDGCHSDCA